MSRADDPREDPEREPDDWRDGTAGSSAPQDEDGGDQTPAQQEQDKPRRPFLSFLRESVIVVVSALVISLVLKTWFIQPFSIPSVSMQDTLQVGDRIVVNKLAPGPMDLERGDVVVFLDPGGWLSQVDRPELNPLERALTWVGLLPEDAGRHLVKRVVGMPGDRVICCDDAGRITINGVGVDEPYLAEGVEPSDLEFDVTVPEGHLFVLGDNRSQSADSRYNTNAVGGGFVPTGNVVGTVFLIIWPLNRLEWMSDQDSVFDGVPKP